MPVPEACLGQVGLKALGRGAAELKVDTRELAEHHLESKSAGLVEIKVLTAN